MELDSRMELIILNPMSDLRKLYLPLRTLLLLHSRACGSSVSRLAKIEALPLKTRT